MPSNESRPITPAEHAQMASEERLLGISLTDQELERYQSTRARGGGRWSSAAIANFEFWLVVEDAAESQSPPARDYVLPIVDALRSGESVEDFLVGKSANQRRRFRYHWGQFITRLASKLQRHPAVVEQLQREPSQAAIFG